MILIPNNLQKGLLLLVLVIVVAAVTIFTMMELKMGIKVSLVLSQWRARGYYILGTHEELQYSVERELPDPLKARRCLELMSFSRFTLTVSSYLIWRMSSYYFLSIQTIAEQSTKATSSANPPKINICKLSLLRKEQPLRLIFKKQIQSNIP